jgi:hypothetical protein
MVRNLQVADQRYPLQRPALNATRRASPGRGQWSSLAGCSYAIARGLNNRYDATKDLPKKKPESLAIVLEIWEVFKRKHT